MKDTIEKKKLAILRILQESNQALNSLKITERLLSMGHDISERTVRSYLLELDHCGMITNLGKKGRRITETGLKELSIARVIEKVGHISAKIDQMTYRMNFNLSKKAGTVVINLSVIAKSHLQQAVLGIKKVFAAGYAMGELMSLYGPGETVGDSYISVGHVGIGTVCSVTINGVLLAHGIHTISRFGGLLEIRDGAPTRFVEIIDYDCTTLDPLEIFTRNGMVDHSGLAASGNGCIGACFHEFPAESSDRVMSLAKSLKDIGLGGLLSLGSPGRPLLGIPVTEGRVGAVFIGGLNPVAGIETSNIHVKSCAMAALADYLTLFHFSELDSRAAKVM